VWRDTASEYVQGDFDAVEETIVERADDGDMIPGLRTRGTFVPLRFIAFA
jgi:hypothetical protein